MYVLETLHYAEGRPAGSSRFQIIVLVLMTSKLTGAKEFKGCSAFISGLIKRHIAERKGLILFY